MVNLTINLENDKSRILDLYKVKRGFKNKTEAISDLIEDVREQFSEEDIKADWRNDIISDKQIFRLKEMGIEFKKDITKGEAYIVIKENTK